MRRPAASRADEAAARRAYGALHTYTIGFAALEASRRRAPDSREDAGSLAHQLAAYTTAEQFTEGLRYLLDGIGGQARAGREPGAVTTAAGLTACNRE